jgi:hypothetical protein
MSIVRSLPAILLLALLFSACEKDDSKPTVTPTIKFLTWEGYTFRNDTVGMQDTLRVGVVIERGTDAMHSFKVTSSYNGATPIVRDSLPLGMDSFEFEKVIITRNQPGSERWSFEIRENDGDIIRRALTFTVQ